MDSPGPESVRPARDTDGEAVERVTSVRVDRITWWQSIRTSSLPHGVRLLALTMSTYMDPDGSRCFPGQDALAEACGWKDARSVRRALTVLEDEGYVLVERYGGQRANEGRQQATHRYVPTVPVDEQSDADVRQDDPTSRTPQSGRSGTSRTPEATSRTLVADQSDSGVRQPPHDLTKDPTTGALDVAESPARARPGVARDGRGDRRQPPDDDPVDAAAVELHKRLGVRRDGGRQAWSSLLEALTPHVQAGRTVAQLVAAVSDRGPLDAPDVRCRVALIASRLRDLPTDVYLEAARSRVDVASDHGRNLAASLPTIDDASAVVTSHYADDPNAADAFLAAWRAAHTTTARHEDAA